MSTAEAEYVSLSACCAQVIWMRTQLLDYGYKYNRISMYCDSKSAIAISCNPVQHSKTKHIDIRYHFIKEHVKTGTVELYFVGTEYQLTDLFTKALPKECFEYLVHRIGLHYALEHPSTLIAYLRFIKLIVGHYMTAFPEISRRVHDKYHNLEHDEMVKSIFNSRKNKTGVGMKITSWMITDEMKLIKNYPMYAEAFRVKEMIVQDTIQLIITEQKSHDDLEAKQNEETFNEHLRAKEIKKMVEGTENVENNEVVNSVLNNQEVSTTRIQCYNYKEFRHVARECQKPKRAKDAAYHMEKMLLCKQEEAGIQLNAEQADWRDDTDDESEDQELKHIICT
nr:retrovirus-related Pol polyprotein from transposon TNT 1-94 [Tanacetum cinerariifolium]